MIVINGEPSGLTGSPLTYGTAASLSLVQRVVVFFGHVVRREDVGLVTGL